MLALFWYSPVPYWMDRNRLGHPAFFMEGETHADIAWDLVDHFVDGYLTQHIFAGKEVLTVGGLGIIDAAVEIDPNMMRLQEYHEARFGSPWWEKHHCIVGDYLSRAQADKTLPVFECRFSQSRPEWLLIWYLKTMIAYAYAPHHGHPNYDTMTPETALAYLSGNTYLKWISQSDSQAIQKLLSGDLSAYF